MLMHTNRGWSAGAECYTETGGETRRDEAEGWMDGAVNTIGQSKRGGGDRSSRPASIVSIIGHHHLHHRYGRPPDVQTGGALKL
jgi:hypothetical protein